MKLRNRLVRSATWEGLATEQGEVTDRLVRIYEQLAEGGVGLIISSYLYIRADGKQNNGQLGIYGDHLVPGLTTLADSVHSRGGRLIGQIVHCGGQASREFNGGVQPLAPSSVESPGYKEIPRALTTDEVGELIQEFAAAAERLEQAGFDGIQLHGAHGYLISEFLSPVRNTRADQYGGSRENRARFALEIHRAIRSGVGGDFLVTIKLNGSDFAENAADEEDSTYLAAALAADGIDAIEVSGGTPASGQLGAVRKDIRRREDEAYFRPQLRLIRRAVPELPLMLVGGLRSPEVMKEILDAGEADYFSMSRPLIREPDLPSRWARGDRRRASCQSCLGCFRPTRRGEGIRCVNANPEKQQTDAD